MLVSPLKANFFCLEELSFSKVDANDQNIAIIAIKNVYQDMAALFSSATDILIENKRIEEDSSPFSIRLGRSLINISTALKQKS